ncbi:hypothetical protein E4T56_gene16107, partial [Termitomyces sp. T112]
ASTGERHLYQDITVERSGAVAIVVLSRPHRLNALTTRVWAEVEHAVLAAVEERARAILLTGERQFFSVGTDMEPGGDAYTGLTDDLGAVLEQRANPLMKLLADLPMPLVCSVNGPAIGAAVGLALLGDLLVMGQRSYPPLAPVGVGLVPDTGGTWLVARSMGGARAMQRALFGEREALALATRLAEGPTRAMGAIRRQINYAMDNGLSDVLAFEAEQQRTCGRTQDFAVARQRRECMDFPKGTALIFGGSGGIGKGVAEEFARAGTDVAICYRSKRDVAEATAATIQALGVEASVHQLDVRDRAQVEAGFNAAVARHGRLADVTQDQFRQAVEVEVFGFFNAAQAAIPHMRQAGGGSFVHLGSAGHDWWPKLDGLSVAPKAANEALVKGIAKEEGRHEIRANSVLVGVIDAGMFHELTAQGHFDAKWIEETHKLLALKRWGEARDIGQAAVFFASDRARYVTGQTISVSGGFGV